MLTDQSVITESLRGRSYSVYFCSITRLQITAGQQLVSALWRTCAQGTMQTEPRCDRGFMKLIGVLSLQAAWHLT
jgi:hypothetical protein